jgi:hypothetical protein
VAANCWRVTTSGFLVTSLLLASGCRPNYGTFQVTGRVPFAGRPPPASCAVYFMPLDSTIKGWSGIAICDANGVLRAGSYNPRDGLLPGRYRANVRCHESLGDETTAASSHVPEGFVGPEFTVPDKPAAPVTDSIDVR